MLGKKKKVKAKEMGPEVGMRGEEKPRGEVNPQVRSQEALGQEFKVRPEIAAGSLREWLKCVKDLQKIKLSYS